MVSRTNHRYGLLVIGIMLLAVACSTSTPVASQPPPTATVILTDTATPTDVPVSTLSMPRYNEAKVTMKKEATC